MAKGKKRHFVNGRSQETFAQSAGVPIRIFGDDPIETVGFSDEILPMLKIGVGISTVRSLMNRSSVTLRRWWGLREYMPEILDTIDEYIYSVIEKRRQEYYENPVPVYTLIGVKDISRYANCLLYDFNKTVLRYDGALFAHLRANGIITVQDFLKIDLGTWHECFECEDLYVRVVLGGLKNSLRSVSKLPPMPYPLDPAGKDVITYPLPEDSKEKVSSLTDDRLAGDKVTMKGLSSYEKALYNRAKDAIDVCGADFYYDVLDNWEQSRKLARSLAVFTAPQLELLQRKTMLRSLYAAVPDRIRKMPARALCHYMRPRYVRDDYNWPYRNSYSWTDVVFFSTWRPFRSDRRMMSLEDAFAHFNELMDGCATIDELDTLIDGDRDMQFIDLLDWLSHANMLNAIFDCFLRPQHTHSHEATKQMREVVPETDPDEVIARFNDIKKSRQRPDEFAYYYDCGGDDRQIIWGASYGARYDFIPVYMLLTRKTSVPAAILDGFLFQGDADCYRRYVTGRSLADLCEYDAETDTFSIKDDILQR